MTSGLNLQEPCMMLHCWQKSATLLMDISMGHEVGGTNPSLLEALSTTKLNLLLDVGFNKEVGEDAALYWNKKNGNLATLIQKADTMDEAEREELGRKAKDRMKKWYSWEAIVQQYETLFLTGEEERE